MKTVIDLYDYFKISKPDGARAELTCYLRDNSIEINPNRKAPAMLVIPGGGYGMVSDREGEPIAIAYLNAGFSAFVLRYSIAPVRYPNQLVEAVMAMAYIRINAKEFHIDENMVSAIGFSAGGHLCGMLATIPDCEDVKDVFSAPVPTKPNAVVLSYPVITSANKAHIGSFDNLCGEGNLELQRKLDISNLVNENSAPAFIWATYNDNVVPVRNSLVVANAYEKAGVKFSIHVWGNGQHGLSVANKTVYGVSDGKYSAIENASKSVGKWVNLSIEWLEEIGIGIKD